MVGCVDTLLSTVLLEDGTITNKEAVHKPSLMVRADAFLYERFVGSTVDPLKYWEQHFVPCSEVSLTQGLLGYFW